MAATWTLHIQTGDDPTTRVVALGAAPVRVGRGIQCEVRLNQVGLGDVQCTIRRRDNEWQVQPVGPPGRIFLDGRPTETQRPLAVGALLQVGRSTLTIHQADPTLSHPGSFDAPIAVAVAVGVGAGAGVEVDARDPLPAAIAPPVEPSEPITTPPAELLAEPAGPDPGDDRVKRWQTRLDQRDQWLKDRQSEKRWEARWKAAGETLRARSDAGSPPPPSPARPAPPIRPIPPRSASPRTFEPRPVFGHTRRVPGHDLKAEPQRVPLQPEAVAAPAPPPLALPVAAEPEAALLAPVPPVLEPRSLPEPEQPAEPTPPEPDRVAPPMTEFEDVEAVLAYLARTVVAAGPVATEERAPTLTEPEPVTVAAAPPVVVKLAPPASPVPAVDPPEAPVVTAERPAPAIAPRPQRSRPILRSQPTVASPAVDDQQIDPPAPSPRADRSRVVSARGPSARPAPADPGFDPLDGVSKRAAATPVGDDGPRDRAQPVREPFPTAGLAFPAAKPHGSARSAAKPAPDPAEGKDYPSARAIFAAQGIRGIGRVPGTPLTTPAEPARKRRTPEPTAAVRPDAWTVPLALGWLPAAALVVTLGTFAVGLAVVWLDDASSGNIAVRLATRSETAYSPVIDATTIPKSAWWETTASHLAAWALVLDRAGNGENRSADARILEADARSVSPLGARARFVSEPIPGQEADASTSVRLGPTRDVIPLTAMAHRLRQQNKRADAARAYRVAFLTAATTARSTLSRPVFRGDEQVNRYALPHSTLLDEIARDMVAAGDWTAEEWSEVTPEFGPALLAVAAALRPKDPAESERRLEAICQLGDRPLDPRFEAAEHQASVAEALAERGRWTDAAAQYRQAIDGESRDLDRRVWWFNLAEVYRRGGEDKLRKQAIEAAKGADLSDEVTQRAANAHNVAPETSLSVRNR